MRKHHDFLAVTDFSREQIIETLALARELKERAHDHAEPTPLEGQTWGLIFHKPSLRTRISFEVGIHQLGGSCIYITDKEIELGKRESIADAARVLSRYLGGIMIRTFNHADVEELAEYADIPIINGLTDLLHPCQIMADILTIYEKLGRYEDFRIAYLGDGNNITNSWLNLSTLLGFQLVVATSPETLPNQELIEKAKAAGKSEIIVTDDPAEAVKDAHVIYTDVWASMGQKAEAAKQAERLRAFQINTELVQKSDPKSIVMHCLPAERGREITDDVMDGPHSVVFDQAENRLHAQKAVMTILVE